MKIALLCLISIIAFLHLASTNPVNDLDAQWTKYKVDFEKKYDDPKEDARRKEIFRQNLIEIDEHNAKYKAGEVTWFKGINQFSDITKEEFKASHGGSHIAED